jgi:hypothetical protein
MQRVARHLAGCAACATAASEVRTASAAVGATLQASPLRPLDVDAMWRRLQPQLSAPTPLAVPSRWRWVWRTAWAVAGAAAVALWLGSRAVGGPDAVLITTGVKPPPSPLKERPDLFKDYAIIEELDVLERFDTADTEAPLDGVTPGADQG